jgi:hypothetical protein
MKYNIFVDDERFPEYIKNKLGKLSKRLGNN